MGMSIDEQVDLLMQGTDYGDAQTAVVMRRELRARLMESEQTGRKLRVYCGYDPRTTDLHLGHTITMRKLRQFQDLDHHVTFLIGTYTSLIGDPSDVDKTRTQLTAEQVQENARTYAEQAFKILDREKTTVRQNAEWLAPLTFKDVIEMAANFTVQQFLARENFRKRLDAGEPIYLHETFYSLMQAYDAVAQGTDVQVGGADQLFNIVVAGRKLQEAMDQRPMVALIMGESLPGTDGEVKMSKSLGNHIPIMTTPEDMFGKVMSVPDKAMLVYHKLLLGWGAERLTQLEQDMRDHPRDVKVALARQIVATFHGEEAADKAAQHFNLVFREHGIPDDIPEFMLEGEASLVDVLAQSGMVPSKKEGRRMIQQNAVRVNDETIKSHDHRLQLASGQEAIVKVGKRKFLRVRQS